MNFFGFITVVRKYSLASLALRRPKVDLGLASLRKATKATSQIESQRLQNKIVTFGL